MGRNSSGTYSLPSPGVPFQSGQTISSAQVNSTLSDIAAALTDSASRTGSGGFSAPVRGPDGTVAAPGHSFVSEPGSGLYKAATGDVRLAVAGVDMITPAGIAFPSAASPTVKSTGATTSLLLQGNRGAAEGFADVTIGSTATRTAGLIADFHNPIGVTSKLQVDFQGLLRLSSQAAPLQPASIWTAITPNAGVTAAKGAAFWKTANGDVRLKGSLVNNTGGATANFVTTTPLPTGFRPAFDRWFPITGLAGGLNAKVSTTGTITLDATVGNGTEVFLDPISFLAEA